MARKLVPDRLNTRLPFVLCSLALASLLCSPIASAETLRVTSLNLAGATNLNLLNDSSGPLKRLEPDVILLQGVSDWKFCNDLAAALRPAHYLVLVCSSFGSEASAAQVAVLSKYKGYFSWAQPWDTAAKGGGGFAFVALDVKGQRLGIFSAMVAGAGTADFQPLLEQAQTAAKWEANRVQSFVVGVGASPGFSSRPEALTALTLLTKAGYNDAFGAIPAHDQSLARILDRFFVQSPLFPGNPTLSQTLDSSHPVLTCDVELDPAKAAAAWTARAQDLERLAAEKLKSQQQAAATLARSAATPPGSNPHAPATASLQDWRFLLALASALLALAAAWFALRSRAHISSPRTPPLLANNMQPAISYTLVLDTPAEARSAATPPILSPESSPHWQQRALAAEARAAQANYVLKTKLSDKLANWLKRSFVARLMRDRDELLQTQQDAAFRALKVDERLSRVEQQIQKQTQAYQQKIDELTLELHAAREENRELIRARIAQVKLEMEAVRARMLASASQDPP